MKENKYFEYQTFVPMWGLFLNSKKKIQQVIDHHNQDGWTVKQFDWGVSRGTVLRLMLVWLITVLTLGFLTYWSGFTIVFEREV